ncbi:hypothetical protein ANCDUO_08976, partial [Ancylostoma duodenale]
LLCDKCLFLSDEISENFISKLAKEIVEDAILDAVIEHSDELNECEESEEQFSTSSAEHSKTEVPLDVKILNFFFKIFTFKNMARYLVLLLALMLADTLWDIIVDVYSRPTILKPKGPRPFFPNSSSSYLLDLYTGEFRPERSDLLPLIAGQLRFDVTQRSLGMPSAEKKGKWVVNVRNPLQRIHSVEQLNLLKRDYHTVVIGYFPFTGMNTPPGYRAFAAAEDESTCLAVVTSVQLARELGIRFESDIIMYIPKDRNSELMSPQLSQLLNETSALVLITPLARIYRNQPDVVLFTELAREYWNCEQDNIQRINSEPRFIPRPPLLDELANDKQACAEVVEGITKMDSCCRSLLPSVDWNMACASSAKFHWEDEENIDERNAVEKPDKSSRRRRNVVLSRCCANYEEFSQQELTSVHKANSMSKLHARELMLVDLCMRSRLHDYMKYPVLNETLDLFDEPSPASNLSLKGMACRSGHVQDRFQENDTLKFAVLDSLHYSYFVDKWGLSKFKNNFQLLQLPLLVAIDIRRELFSVMEAKISQKRVREFVRDFHSNLLEDHLKSEDDSIARSSVTTKQPVHPRVRNEQVLQRLTLRSFHELIENRHNTTNDVVVFFSGGSWHAPSTAAMHE